jgi:hypothetical protein
MKKLIAVAMIAVISVVLMGCAAKKSCCGACKSAPAAACAKCAPGPCKCAK